jgi:hypothetical protein
MVTMATSGSMAAAMTTAFAAIDPAVLASVIGGAATDADTAALGRCGPGSRWPILGNIYTPACLAHDRSVRGAEQRGVPKLLAHLQALPLLPAAIGSWVKAKVAGR